MPEQKRTYATSSNTGARRPVSNGKRRKKKKKRQSGGLLIVLLLLIVIAAVVVMVTKGGGSTQPEATQAPAVIEQTDTSSEQTAAVSTAAATPAPTTYTYTTKTINRDKLSMNTDLNGTWKSVLMVGTDARLWDDMKHTDSMIIVCYNQKTGAIRMISVMRDIFVDISEYGSSRGNVRINTVSAFTNMETLIRMLNEKLGLNISDYMLVDFQGFVEVVDILGGIDVDLTEVEMQYVNSSLTEEVNLLVDKQRRQSTLEACTLTTYGNATHLNGLQALAYARTRKSDNDFKRTQRQRTVILQAATKAINTVSITQLGQIAGSMLQHVETTLSLTDCLTLGTSVMTMGLTDINQTRLPVNDSYTGETRNNTWGMYDMDWNMNKAEVQAMLYE